MSNEVDISNKVLLPILKLMFKVVDTIATGDNLKIEKLKQEGINYEYRFKLDEIIKAMEKEL